MNTQLDLDKINKIKEVLERLEIMKPLEDRLLDIERSYFLKKDFTEYEIYCLSVIGCEFILDTLKKFNVW